MISFKSPLKNVSAFCSLGLLLLLTVALLCTGCAETNEILGVKDKTQVEQSVLRSYAKGDSQRQKAISCSLVQESPNKYKGVVYAQIYSDDGVKDVQQRVTVTTDNDGYLIEPDGELISGEWRQR